MSSSSTVQKAIEDLTKSVRQIAEVFSVPFPTPLPPEDHLPELIEVVREIKEVLITIEEAVKSLKKGKK